MPEDGTFIDEDTDPIPPGLLSRGEKTEKRASIGAAKKAHIKSRSKSMRLKRSHTNVRGRNLK